MEEIWKDPEKRRRILIVGGIVLALVMCLSIVRCTSIHSDDPGGVERPDTEESAEQIEPAPEEIGAFDVELSDAQLDAFSAMDDEARDFIGLLTSQLWTSTSETNALEATSYGIRESGEAFPYAVCDVDAYKYSYTVDGIVNDVDARCAFVMLDDGSYSHIKIATTSVLYPDGIETTIMNVTSPLFKNQAGYQRAAAATDLALDGPSADLLSFIGTSSGNLLSEMKDFCSVSYPTATTATWTGTFTYERDAGSYVWQYRLDNTSRSVVKVVFYEDDKSYEIS